MAIVSEELTYTYDKKSKFSHRALDGVTLTVEDGDFFGIIGRTGSGKSTFIQHLNGLLPVQKNAGKLTVSGVDLTAKNVDMRALRKTVGMVFQYPEYQLFAETVYEDVAFALKNFEPNLEKEEKDERVKRALNAVGLNYDAVKDVSPFDLSGGQKRRVAIAGVLAARPEILVLDEPVAGLDPEGKASLLALLKRLHETVVKTVIIVSHDMNIVAENCNRVAVFDEGKAVLVGTADEVFSDKETLRRAGLDLPLTAWLYEKLNEKGVRLTGGVKADAFLSAVKKYAGENGK